MDEGFPVATAWDAEEDPDSWRLTCEQFSEPSWFEATTPETVVASNRVWDSPSDWLAVGELGRIRVEAVVASVVVAVGYSNTFHS